MENAIYEFVRMNASKAFTVLPGTIGLASYSVMQFKLAMLCISLIIGIFYCSYAGYIYWFKGRSFLSYVIALAFSLLLDTFFRLLEWTIFVMGESTDVPGSNTLIAFQCFFATMSISYWLILTIYLHESVECSFNSEPSIKLFHYGVPGVATFFTFIWIFILAGQFSDWLPILTSNTGYTWVIDILILLYLCLQLILTVSIAGMIVAKKTTLDNECTSLIRKGGFAFIGLIALFWIKFGFTVANVPVHNTETFLYFSAVGIDLQCAIACPLLFFLEKWGQEISDKFPKGSTPRVATVSGSNIMPTKTQEMLIKTPNRRTISTLESVYGEQGGNRPETDTRDVVYTNVVPPERLQKTFDLYRRLKIFPAGDWAFDLSDEKFYECREDDAKTVYKDCISKASDNMESEGEPDEGSERRRKDGQKELGKITDGTQKKNAFYVSKYLVVEPKSLLPKNPEGGKIGN